MPPWPAARCLDEYTNNPTLGVTGDAIPNVPEIQFNVGLNYTRPIYGDWEGMLAADITYRDFGQCLLRLQLASTWAAAVHTGRPAAGADQGPWSVDCVRTQSSTDKRAQVSAINSTQDPHALLTVQPRTIGRHS